MEGTESKGKGTDYSEREDIFEPKFEKFASLLESSRRIGVLTGAGVSTMSGIPDFRGSGGLYTKEYERLPVERILDIDFFHSHPEIFYRWAADVWFKLENYEPNIVHKTLARMERLGIVKEVFTQNIDLLHRRAGSKNVYEVHGSPEHNYCVKCHKHFSYEEIAPIASKGEVPYCTRCGGVVKPDIVFYGEALDSSVLMRAEEVFGRLCDLCVVLGSSLNVGPINQLPYLAVAHGAALVIVNAQGTPMDGYATLRFRDLRQTCEALNRRFDEAGRP